VQYTHARTCSMLRRAEDEKGVWITTDDINPSLLQNKEALAVIRELHLFGERIEQAMHKLEQSIVTRYLVDLTQEFNRFTMNAISLLMMLIFVKPELPWSSVFKSHCEMD
jgi:arginyl-tRNA synthetase